MGFQALLEVCFCGSKKGEYGLEQFFVKPYQAREEERLHLANLDLFLLVNHVTLRAPMYPDSILTSRSEERREGKEC